MKTLFIASVENHIPGWPDEHWVLGGEDYDWSGPEETLSSTIKRHDLSPDLIVVASSEYKPFPYLDYQDCPVLLIAGDWNLLYHCLSRVAKGCDGALVNAFAEQPFFQRLLPTAVTPLWSFPDHKHQNLNEIQERDLDISFVGNVNLVVQQERVWYIRETLKPILNRHEGWKHLVGSGLFGQDYTDVLYRSKIVFNRSIKSEINMRAYEAVGCGALCFLESQNRQLSGHPLSEVIVPYTDDNLEFLLDYWLTHDREREERAARGIELANTVCSSTVMYQNWHEAATNVQPRLHDYSPVDHGLVLTYEGKPDWARLWLNRERRHRAEAYHDLGVLENNSTYLQLAVQENPNWLWPRLHLGLEPQGEVTPIPLHAYSLGYSEQRLHLERLIALGNEAEIRNFLLSGRQP